MHTRNNSTTCSKIAICTYLLEKVYIYYAFTYYTYILKYISDPDSKGQNMKVWQLSLDSSPTCIYSLDEGFQPHPSIIFDFQRTNLSLTSKTRISLDTTYLVQGKVGISLPKPYSEGCSPLAWYGSGSARLKSTVDKVNHIIGLDLTDLPHGAYSTVR